MKIKFNIDSQLPEERAEFWLHKMTDKMQRIAKDLSSDSDSLWCYQEDNVIPVSFDQIMLIEVVADKTYVYTLAEQFEYKERLYKVKEQLPYDFFTVSRSSIINYHQIDHLEMVEGGNIDVILKNERRVQISRRRIKDLKARLGL
ncbi:MAG: LytTR family DNA-binding domain-containing protein [Lactobacillus kalixensis]|uniref:LytTR family DNA-binding domain-containing protein n=1 Tax=Lactobacillus kalixensis TaxID=227944 RepID=UPI003993805A